MFSIYITVCQWENRLSSVLITDSGRFRSFRDHTSMAPNGFEFKLAKCCRTLAVQLCSASVK